MRYLPLTATSQGDASRNSARFDRARFRRRAALRAKGPIRSAPHRGRDEVERELAKSRSHECLRGKPAVLRRGGAYRHTCGSAIT